MKKILLIAALAAVSACSKPAATTGADASATPEASAPAATATNIAADGKPSVGKYKVNTADGKVIVEEVKADGTYVDTADGKVVETGRWEQKSPAVYCYTSDKKGSAQVCNDEKVENGVYTSRNPEGKTSTVVRLGG